MELKGKICYIDASNNVSKDPTKEFNVRSFCIDLSVEINGSLMQNYGTFQVVGRNCDLLNSVNIGDTVLVTFGVNGQAPKRKDGAMPSEKNPQALSSFCNLNAYKIEVLERAQAEQKKPISAPQQQTQSQANDDLPF